ncbi:MULTISPECIES: glycosyltransferase family 2 protein [Haloferax]|uniref:glycosyltransferase family 2 protein n=1 Tax=Haloferax TaxID=2251 RepID=UPI000E252014|nr:MULTISPECIES: glycosyltransferase family 2 protein [Haloferax]RDZ35265.1 glycosyltransferase family 2 protein [Haloferax sp. Atlit-24N]RLM35676.1 glycosyltransferase family 2 protein [Haloferax sp. Atlit-109R]RLM43524.1 glycosyltransferase family 2 protein [Haloferax sp. Atlit-105R]WEL26794.1 Glycosyl transferase family 2 [Haloferax lucentense]
MHSTNTRRGNSTGVGTNKLDTGSDSNRSSERFKSSSHDTKTVVGIPAYNEEVGIGSTVLAAQQYAEDVVVVDDGSTDNTVPIARAAGATVIVHKENQGKGGAVQTLLDHAQQVECDAFVILDGDGQHHPSDIPQVVTPVVEGKSDLVIGSRYLEPKEGDETPLYRRFGQRVLDILTVGSSGQNLTDTQSGFRAFSPIAIEKLSVKTSGMGVESEMIGDAVDKGLAIEEIPINVRYEGIDGQTYSPLRHGLTVATFILQLIRDRHPLIFFGVPGSVLTLAGTLYGLDAILIYQSSGIFYPGKVLAAGFFAILGVLGIFVGLILNRISNMLNELKHEIIQ